MDINVSAVADAVLRAIENQSGEAIGEIPVGISNRHIHLSKEHVEILFGAGYELTPFKELSQPGQYACKEQLTIVGPSLRPIEKVRVLGPVRSASQVEISRTDSYQLKVAPPVRESGKIAGSAPITIIGPNDTWETEFPVENGEVNIQGATLSNGKELHVPEKEYWAYNGWQFRAEKRGPGYVEGE